MLDVHPPHHPTHTWQDFFIHIATIVIGLLIAVGLEQTVEAIHHHRQRDEARERLIQEIKDNGETAQDNIYALHAHQRRLTHALEVLERQRTHTLLPTDRIITLRGWLPVKVTAWKTARESGAAAFLSPTQQAQFELANWDAETFNASSREASISIGRASIVLNMHLPSRAAVPVEERSTLFGHKGDAAEEELVNARRAVGSDVISRLTPAEIDRLQQAIEASLSDDDNLLNDCSHLTAFAAEVSKPGYNR